MITVMDRLEHCPVTKRTDGRFSTVGPIAARCVALALILSSCGSSQPDELSFSETIDPSSELTANWDSLDAQSEPGDTTTRGQFQDLVTMLGSSYRFESRLTGEDGSSVELSGERVGVSVRYEMFTGGVTVEVVDLGDTIWTRVDGGPWAMSTSTIGDDPILGLSSPLSVKIGASSGSFEAVYDRSVFGLGGDEPVSVLVIGVEDFQSQGPRVTFSALDESVTILSVLAGDPSLEPITAPE